MLFYILSYQFKPYKQRPVPLLTANHTLKRLKFCYWWRKKANFYKRKQFMFSDEKIFTVNGGMNSQNSRVYCYSREEADRHQGEKNSVIFLYRKSQKNYLKKILNYHLQK